MPDQASAGGVVYRDGKDRVACAGLVRGIEVALAKLRTEKSNEALLAALLRAGELECAVSDAARDDAACAAALTDHLASLACAARNGREVHASLQQAEESFSNIDVHGDVTISRPEGFAYYALHPLDFADLVRAAKLSARCAFVIGIRSIGTTLSAVAAAELRRTGVPATRTTVRPIGNPYDRRCTFNLGQRQAIREALTQGAVFLICDEGPGRSGSSFLSVAEALEREAVPRHRILLLCSHQPDVDALCAPQAAARWRRYQSLASGPTRRLPAQAGEYVGGGEWRRILLPAECRWPAAWPQMERLKYLSRDGSAILKFEGYGPNGEAVRARAESLSAGGYGPKYLGQYSGFGMHPLIREHGMRATDVSPGFLSHIANYCDFRARAFRAGVSPGQIQQLERMTSANLEAEFGSACEIRLEMKRPAICDSRMQPAKWRVFDGTWLKLDASTHGDDHFYPGPADIAWDLAGTCVEWNLTGNCREFLLQEYRRVSGDDPGPRLRGYELAYVAFRLAWCKMAAGSIPGSDDQPRLLREYGRYRAIAESLQPRAAELAAPGLLRHAVLG